MRILVTGMSGTGKSTLLDALRALGYRTVDTDEPGWSEQGSDGGWLWREARMRTLLEKEEGTTLFVSGTVANQVKFYPTFDRIILLSAPREVIVHRLTTRTNNPYGKGSGELEEVLHYLETVEPLLRRGATHEIDTSRPVEEVLERVLEAVNPRSEQNR